MSHEFWHCFRFLSLFLSLSLTFFSLSNYFYLSIYFYVSIYLFSISLYLSLYIYISLSLSIYISLYLFKKVNILFSSQTIEPQSRIEQYLLNELYLHMLALKHYKHKYSVTNFISKSPTKSKPPVDAVRDLQLVATGIPKEFEYNWTYGRT